MLRLFVMAMLAIPTLAQAAGQTSCPPLGELPGYLPEAARVRAWEGREFTGKVDAGSDTEDKVQYGRTCQINYRIKAGANPMSNSEVQENYRQELKRLGAELQFEGGRDTYAKLVKDGTETWFRVYGGEDVYELTVLRVEPPKLTLLPPSGNDYKLLGHMPDFIAAKPVISNYDTMIFNVIESDAEKEVAAQGRTTKITYEYKGKDDPLTNAEINWNYREALKQLGAEILFTGSRDTTARVLRDGQVVWMRVYAGETSIEISALEEKPFEPAIKPAPPAQLQATLAKAGRVTLYVNFDFDRAVLRPEAGPVVDQVVAAMKADPTLRLQIVGHTDALGTAEHNRKLSTERAASFAAAVASRGITADRLTSAGMGPDQPIAANDTSEGRAKNRRVELVRI